MYLQARNTMRETTRRMTSGTTSLATLRASRSSNLKSSFNVERREELYHLICIYKILNLESTLEYTINVRLISLIHEIGTSPTLGWKKRLHYDTYP